MEISDIRYGYVRVSGKRFNFLVIKDDEPVVGQAKAICKVDVIRIGIVLRIAGLNCGVGT